MKELNERLKSSPLFLSAKEGYHILIAIGIFFILWLTGLFLGRVVAKGVFELLRFIQYENNNGLAALRKVIVCGTQIAVFFLWVKLYEKRTIKSSRFLTKNPMKAYFLGAVIGGGAILIVTASLWLMGAVRFKFAPGDSMTIGLNILLIGIGWIVQSASEEIAIRGWLIPTMGKNSSPVTAIVATALIFGVLHLFTKGVTVLSFVNLTLSGLFFALYAIRSGNIIGVCGLHFMWNLTLGNIFGFPVSGFISGTQTIFALSYMESNALTGGAFGPEGGLITTAVLLFSVGVILLTWRKNTRLD